MKDLQSLSLSGTRTTSTASALGVLSVVALATLLGAGRRAPASALGSGGGGFSTPDSQATNTGAIEGVVTLAGDTLPAPTTVANTTDPEICGSEHSLRDLVVSRESRGIRWVVVSLAGVSEGAIPDRPPGRLVIDNRDCQFAPHVAVATVGDTIVARNSDPTLHNTHYYGPMRSNIALAVEGMTASRVARRTGLVTVLCDVHGWMKAYVRIDPHPFHAVTDARGRFRIERVPAGSYTLELWHEELGTRVVEVEVEAGEVTTVKVEYSEPGE